MKTPKSGSSVLSNIDLSMKRKLSYGTTNFDNSTGVGAMLQSSFDVEEQVVTAGGSWFGNFRNSRAYFGNGVFRYRPIFLRLFLPCLLTLEVSYYLLIVLRFWNVRRIDRTSESFRLILICLPILIILGLGVVSLWLN